jgi:hypothetical protein
MQAVEARVCAVNPNGFQILGFPFGDASKNVLFTPYVVLMNGFFLISCGAFSASAALFSRSAAFADQLAGAHVRKLTAARPPTCLPVSLYAFELFITHDADEAVHHHQILSSLSKTTQPSKAAGRN